MPADRSTETLPPHPVEPAPTAAPEAEARETPSPDASLPPLEPLEWRVHLARTAPGKAAVVLLFAGASALLCFSLFHNLLFALFTLLALIGATAEFLFPIRYRLDGEGAEMRNLHNWRRISWADVRKAYLLEDGIKLSPFSVRSRLETFRGVFLRFGEGAGEREAVTAAVREYRDRVRRNPD